MGIDDPLKPAKAGLAHREADAAVPWGDLGKREGDDAGADLVADLEVPLRLDADEPLVVLIDVDPVVHDLADVEKTVERAEPDERPELPDLDDRPLDDLLDLGTEDERVGTRPPGRRRRRRG